MEINMVDKITGRFLQQYNVKNQDIFKSNTPDMYWLLGMMASDGCITTTNRVTISQSGDHGKRCINKIKKMFDTDYPIYQRKPIKGNISYTLNIPSATIIHDLIAYNIIPRKTLTYTLPSTIPYNYLNKFIEGYIEGDGTVGVYKNNRNYSLLTILVVGTKEFITELNDIVPVKGYITDIKHSSIYELRWTGKKAVLFGNWVYSDPVYSDSPKYNKYLNYINTITPDYVKYDDIKKNVQSLLDDGFSPIHIATMVGIPFQTVYKWIKKGVILDNRC